MRQKLTYDYDYITEKKWDNERLYYEGQQPRRQLSQWQLRIDKL
jgi:hypothetical protein